MFGENRFKSGKFIISHSVFCSVSHCSSRIFSFSLGSSDIGREEAIHVHSHYYFSFHAETKIEKFQKSTDAISLEGHIQCANRILHVFYFSFVLVKKQKPKKTKEKKNRKASKSEKEI